MNEEERRRHVNRGLWEAYFHRALQQNWEARASRAANALSEDMILMMMGALVDRMIDRAWRESGEGKGE